MVNTASQVVSLCSAVLNKEEHHFFPFMGNVNFKVEVQFIFNAGQHKFVCAVLILSWFRAQNITQDTTICLCDTWMNIRYRDNKRGFELPPQEQKSSRFNFQLSPEFLQSSAAAVHG